MAATPGSVLSRGIGAWGSRALIVTRGLGLPPTVNPAAVRIRDLIGSAARIQSQPGSPARVAPLVGTAGRVG